jgi:predicted DNA-binding transcriptional regulator YafY
MAINKNAILRFRVLDKCFRNPGKKYFIEDLIDLCSNALYEESSLSNGISRRQIFEDIKFMESKNGWNIPLERIRDGHRVHYRYSDLSFSINNQPLNETEENQLKEALLTLSRFKGMPQFEWVDEIAARLDAGLGLSNNTEKIIEFDQNSYLKGLEFITPIYNSILYKKALTIEYQSFKQDISQSITLHPYFLKQYNNRWYVFGKNDASQFIMNLALDRITAIEESKKKYIPNKSIDFNEYFEDIIGVTLNNEGKIENVVIKVSNKLLPYIKTKPIHGSQKLKEQGSSHALISIDVIPNYELESLILSYGEGLEVLYPKLLREKIKERIELTFSNYKNNSADKLHTKA